MRFSLSLHWGMFFLVSKILVKQKSRVNHFVNPLMPGSNKKSYVLKQICGF